MEFCWIPGGWDADRDGVMEGCQHNTMDVEYYGPNAQMGIWYLGALLAAERMATHQKDLEFAATCRRLREQGTGWTDAHLFNGRYYVQVIQPPMESSRVAPSLIVGMGATDFKNPDYQLGTACLVDQLVGQYLAHVCDLGYLVDPGHVRTTLQSIMKYNYRASLEDHFNCMRTFALADESALLMAAYPDGRPENPFPYFSEVMTGFEYTAAIGMLYEGQRENGLQCIKSIRDRYDGRKRNPYDEAECGHHYGRAMASWGAVLALTGFHYSGVDQALTLAPTDGLAFWSNGYAYGTIRQEMAGKTGVYPSPLLKGSLEIKELNLSGFGRASFDSPRLIREGESATVEVHASIVSQKCERERGNAPDAFYNKGGRFVTVKRTHCALQCTRLGTGHVTNARDNESQEKETDPLVLKKLEWFKDMKFGLLMHWGPYSQWGMVESWSLCPEDEGWCQRKGPYAGCTRNTSRRMRI